MVMAFSRVMIMGCLFFAVSCRAQKKFQNDFTAFCDLVQQHYAYLEQQQIDWKKVKSIYEPEAALVKNDTAFIRFLERVINELHNGHSSLNTNLASSNRIVPSGADMYVEEINRKYILTDLRKGRGAELSGMKPGMEIIAFNDLPVPQQLQQFLPRYALQPDSSMFRYALDMLFAGTHDKPRKITIIENGIKKDFSPDSFRSSAASSLLEVKMINPQTGYFGINNSLGNNDLIKEFDRTLDSLISLPNLVLDLTETPGGGNSTVARAIMGRFIHVKQPFQQHEYDEKAYGTARNWVENVVPRGKTYTGRLFILVGHWTGSMGEGVAIGFDAMKRATIIGTKMAGLIGAIEGFRLPETKIGFQIPVERLYHINGTPRERFVPGKLTSNIYQTWVYLNQLLKE